MTAPRTAAGELRAAAAEMRAKAEKATPGRWKLWGMAVMADQDGTSNVDTAVPVCATYSTDAESGRLRTYDADHIAGMHPAVALAVADWLDAAADGLSPERMSLSEAGPYAQGALAVAATYLGTGRQEVEG